MRPLIDASLSKRVTVFFLTASLVFMGFVAYTTLPREKYPDIQIPVVVVSVAYPGAAPLEVEKQIVNPIERELSGLDGLKKMSSTAAESMGLVTVELVSGFDVDVALQKVRDRVNLAKVDFPDEAEEPVLTEVNFSQVPVIQVNLAGDVGPVVLEELAEDLQDELEAMPGVLRADLVGNVEREVQVDVDPRKLAVYDLALDDVVDAVKDENVSIPGGDMELGEVSYAVRVPGEVDDPLEVANFVIDSPGGNPITVRDVAEVRFGFQERVSYARIDGVESVALSVQKRVGANIVELVEQVKATVAEAEVDWPAGVEATFLADQSVQIHRQVRDLENSILSGLFLVLVVLMFALGLRNSIFVALSIPFSMLLTVLALQALGITLNMVVLFALVLAVGMLVDNAVVVIENIYRHMQEGMPRLEAARTATHEVGAAIAVSTFTTVGAFSPLFFWPGVMGDFMKYLPLTVCLALLSSLVVAFTINPVLCSVLMRVAPSAQQSKGADGDAEGDGPAGPIDRFGAAFSARYERLLTWSLDHKLATIGLTFLVAALVVLAFLRAAPGVEFVAEEQPNQIKVDVTMPPGTTLGHTDGLVRELENRLADLPDLRVLAASVGANSQSDEFGGGDSSPHLARLTLDLVERSERSQNSLLTLSQAREKAGQIPGAMLDVAMLEDGLPTGPPIAIEITGDDFEVLGDIARRIRERIEDIPGLVSLEDDFALARPEVRVEVDRVQASRLGLTMANVAGTIRTAINGTDASTYRQGDEEIDVVVRLAEDHRHSIDDLSRLTIVGKNGDQVPLGAIARLGRDSSLTQIKHQDKKRMVTITGQVTRTNLAEPVRTEALARIAEMDELLPSGYAIGLGGQKDEEIESQRFLETAFGWALIIVMTLMVGKFDSILVPAIIISSVTMSVFGVLAGVTITGTSLSIIMTGVGMISLAGIVVNNAIVLLDYAEQQRAKGLSRRQVVIGTGLRRLRPVMLTAITTILGLLPLTTGVEFDFTSMAISTDSESSDYWRAMGVAVIFGLAFATFLTLVLVPLMYDGLWGLRDRLRARGSKTAEESIEDEDPVGLADPSPPGSDSELGPDRVPSLEPEPAPAAGGG